MLQQLQHFDDDPQLKKQIEIEILLKWVSSHEQYPHCASVFDFDDDLKSGLVYCELVYDLSKDKEFLKKILTTQIDRNRSIQNTQLALNALQVIARNLQVDSLSELINLTAKQVYENADSRIALIRQLFQISNHCKNKQIEYPLGMNKSLSKPPLPKGQIQYGLQDPIEDDQVLKKTKPPQVISYDTDEDSMQAPFDEIPDEKNQSDYYERYHLHNYQGEEGDNIEIKESRKQQNEVQKQQKLQKQERQQNQDQGIENEDRPKQQGKINWKDNKRDQGIMNEKNIQGIKLQNNSQIARDNSNSSKLKDQSCNLSIQRKQQESPKQFSNSFSCNTKQQLCPEESIVYSIPVPYSQKHIIPVTPNSNRSKRSLSNQQQQSVMLPPSRRNAKRDFVGLSLREMSELSFQLDQTQQQIYADVKSILNNSFGEQTTTKKMTIKETQNAQEKDNERKDKGVDSVEGRIKKNGGLEERRNNQIDEDIVIERKEERKINLKKILGSQGSKKQESEQEQQQKQQQELQQYEGQISEVIQQTILEWLFELKILKRIPDLAGKLHKICNDGVIFCDLINRLEASRIQPIQGIHRRRMQRSQSTMNADNCNSSSVRSESASNRAGIIANYQRVFEFLRSKQRINNRYLTLRCAETKEQFWGILHDIWACYTNNQTEDQQYIKEQSRQSGSYQYSPMRLQIQPQKNRSQVNRQGLTKGAENIEGLNENQMDYCISERYEDLQPSKSARMNYNKKDLERGSSSIPKYSQEQNLQEKQQQYSQKDQMRNRNENEPNKQDNNNTNLILEDLNNNLENGSLDVLAQKQLIEKQAKEWLESIGFRRQLQKSQTAQSNASIAKNNTQQNQQDPQNNLKNNKKIILESILQDPLRNGVLLCLVLSRLQLAKLNVSQQPETISQCKNNFEMAYRAVKTRAIEIPARLLFRENDIMKGRLSPLWSLFQILSSISVTTTTFTNTGTNTSTINTCSNNNNNRININSSFTNNHNGSQGNQTFHSSCSPSANDSFKENHKIHANQKNNNSKPNFTINSNNITNHQKQEQQKYQNQNQHMGQQQVQFQQPNTHFTSFSNQDWDCQNVPLQHEETSRFVHNSQTNTHQVSPLLSIAEPFSLLARQHNSQDNNKYLSLNSSNPNNNNNTINQNELQKQQMFDQSLRIGSILKEHNYNENNNYLTKNAEEQQQQQQILSQVDEEGESIKKWLKSIGFEELSNLLDFTSKHLQCFSDGTWLCKVVQILEGCKIQGVTWESVRTHAQISFNFTQCLGLLTKKSTFLQQNLLWDIQPFLECSSAFYKTFLIALKRAYKTTTISRHTRSRSCLAK